MSTVTANSKSNIGVYTDVEHNLWVGEAEPSVEQIVNGFQLEHGQALVEMKSTGICGYVRIYSVHSRLCGVILVILCVAWSNERDC